MGIPIVVSTLVAALKFIGIVVGCCVVVGVLIVIVGSSVKTALHFPGLECQLVQQHRLANANDKNKSLLFNFI